MLVARLAALGANVAPDWVTGLEAWARASHIVATERLALDQLKLADLRAMSVSKLSDLFDDAMHGKLIVGPLLLQLDDWTDISRPTAQGDGLVDVEADDEDEEAMFGRRARAAPATEAGGASSGPKRVLKFAVTDGRQDFFAFEYRPCPALDTRTMQKGCKIVVRKCRVLRGFLAFEPACIEVLGGSVPAVAAPPLSVEPEAHVKVASTEDEPIYDDDDDDDDELLRAVAAAEQKAMAARQAKRGVPVKPEPAAHHQRAVPVKASSTPQRRPAPDAEIGPPQSQRSRRFLNSDDSD